jgi:hypothetical protein
MIKGELYATKSYLRIGAFLTAAPVFTNCGRTGEAGAAKQYP